MSDTLMSYDMLQTIADNPEINLTEEEVALVETRCQEIDLNNATAVISFGADTFVSITPFTFLWKISITP